MHRSAILLMLGLGRDTAVDLGGSLTVGAGCLAWIVAGVGAVTGLGLVIALIGAGVEIGVIVTGAGLGGCRDTVW